MLGHWVALPTTQEYPMSLLRTLQSCVRPTAVRGYGRVRVYEHNAVRFIYIVISVIAISDKNNIPYGTMGVATDVYPDRKAWADDCILSDHTVRRFLIAPLAFTEQKPLLFITS